MMATCFPLEILFGTETVAYPHGIIYFLIVKNYVYSSIIVKLEDLTKLSNNIFLSLVGIFTSVLSEFQVIIISGSVFL